MPFDGYAAPLSKSSVSLRLFTCLWHQQHKYVGRKKSTWKAPQKTTTTARNFLLDPARIFITHSIFINFILLTHTTSYSQEILKFKIAMKLPQTRTHIFIFGRAKKAHEKYSAIDWKQIFYMFFFFKWNAVWIYLEFKIIFSISMPIHQNPAFGMGLGTQAHEQGKKHQWDACRECTAVHSSLQQHSKWQ